MNNMSKRFVQQRKEKKRRPRTYQINENRGRVTDLNIDALVGNIMADYKQLAIGNWKPIWKN